MGAGHYHGIVRETIWIEDFCIVIAVFRPDSSVHIWLDREFEKGQGGMHTILDRSECENRANQGADERNEQVRQRLEI
jgi:hypothetical protein